MEDDVESQKDGAESAGDETIDGGGSSSYMTTVEEVFRHRGRVEEFVAGCN